MYPTVDPLAPTGISRRSFFRFAAGASALASLPILTEAHLAYADRPKFADPNKGIHIDANENPMGPSEAARQAMINIIPRGGRYLFNGEEELGRDLCQAGRPEPRVGDALCRLQRAAALHRARLHQQRQAAGGRRSRL